MNQYRYMTISPDGKRYLWRQTTASSPEGLEREMLAAQVPVIQVEPMKKIRQTDRSKVTLQELANYTEQMETGFALGMPLLRMLDSSIECASSPALKKVLTSMKTEIERGNGITAAMRRWPRVFDSIYLSFVTAGEKGSGRMDEAFRQIRTMLVRDQVMRTKVRSVMMMPMVTMIVLILVLAFMMTVVVPKFQVMFGATGATLPAPTQFLVAVSDFVRTHPLLALIAGGGVIFGAIRSSSLFRVFPALHGMALKLPLFGGLQRKVMLANFARTLGQLVNSGVPFVQALYLVRDLSHNVVYRLAIAKAIIAVSNGEKIAVALQPIRSIFGPEILHQISFGEEAGSIPSLLKTLTERQERELTAFIDDMKPVLEAALIAIMGGLVGGIIMALYLPIFNIGKTLIGPS